MSIFTGLFRSRDKPQNRTAGSSYSFFMGNSSAGKPVTERSAMQMTAVYSCVRILSEAVAGLPLHLYRYKEDGGKEKVPGLDIIAESAESGVSIVMARGGREFFVTGHLEYAPNTLDKEYKRDMGKRDDVELPENYYFHDDPNEAPLVTWRAHANLFYSNWINYYVYQETPYNIEDIQ